MKKIEEKEIEKEVEEKIIEIITKIIILICYICTMIVYAYGVINLISGCYELNLGKILGGAVSLIIANIWLYQDKKIIEKI